MAKANKVVKSWRRPFRERGQLGERSRLGLLEKHKDYVLRARDYHAKQKRLKTLKEKARFRNPDEFYFKMINSETKNGAHVAAKRNEVYDAQTIKVLKSQDLNYVQLKSSQEKKKLERLRSTLHMIDDSGLKVVTDVNDERDANRHAGDDDDDDDDDDDGDDDDIEAATRDGDGHVADAGDDGDEDDNDDDDDDDDARAQTTAPAPRRLRSRVLDPVVAARSSRHIVFVDDEEEVKNFDAAQHFDTLPELMPRAFNRPRVEALRKAPLVTNPAKLKSVEKQRKASYAELAARLDRAKQLDTASRELQIQRQLMGKGRRRKVGRDERNLPVYKWAAERKK